MPGHVTRWALVIIIPAIADQALVKCKEAEFLHFDDPGVLQLIRQHL